MPQCRIAQCPKLGAQRVLPSARCVMGSTIFSAQRTVRDTRCARQKAWCSVLCARCTMPSAHSQCHARCTALGTSRACRHSKQPQRHHLPSPAEHPQHRHPTDIGGEVHLGVTEHNPNPSCPSPAQLQFPRRRCGQAWAVGPGRAAAGRRGGPAGRCSAAWPGRKPAPGRLIWFD